MTNAHRSDVGLAGMLVAQGSREVLPRHGDAIREQFVRLHRRYSFYPPADARFVQQLQVVADWLAQRRVLPEQITVSNFLATL